MCNHCYLGWGLCWSNLGTLKVMTPREGTFNGELATDSCGALEQKPPKRSQLMFRARALAGPRAGLEGGTWRLPILPSDNRRMIGTRPPKRRVYKGAALDNRRRGVVRGHF